MKNILYRNWRELRIAAVDLETTGINPNEHRICELGIVYFEAGKPVEVFNRLINPERKIDPAAIKVSGITDEMVKDKKPLSKIKKKCRKHLMDCDAWVMHNSGFDRSHIVKDFKRVGIDIEEKPTFDTRIFADHLWPLGPNKLDAVVQRLRLMMPNGLLAKLNIRKERHRADYDALLCGMALYRFCDRLPVSVLQTLYVQHWMYQTWLKFVKHGEEKYAAMMPPMLPIIENVQN